MKSAAFPIGCVVEIKRDGVFFGHAEIINLRMSNNGARPLPMADVLRADGICTSYYLHDLARWNLERIDFLRDKP
jgi:hypothetical protein